MTVENELNDVMEAISTLSEDSSIPRNVKSKLEKVSEILTGEGELSIKINKSLEEIDELAEDTNLQPYFRTQIWNLVSLMESI